MRYCLIKEQFKKLRRGEISFQEFAAFCSKHEVLAKEIHAAAAELAAEGC